MSSIILENVPSYIEEEYWKKIDYNKLVEYINLSRVKEIETKFYNKDEDNYWPFEWAKDAISFLTRNRWL
jgi:hypothetical protein